MKILVFDMDGTIANLYGYNNWLENLRAENPQPYLECEPLYNMTELNNLLITLKAMDFKIVITSWLCKNSSTEYKKATRQAKVEWLEKYHFPYDEIHLVQYGTPKTKCTRKYKVEQILIDDNEEIRNNWTLGQTINANENILEKLQTLIDNNGIL